MVMQLGVKQNEKQLGTINIVALFLYTLLPLPIGFSDYPCFNMKEVAKSGYHSLVKVPTLTTKNLNNDSIGIFLYYEPRYIR